MNDKPNSPLSWLGRHPWIAVPLETEIARAALAGAMRWVGRIRVSGRRKLVERLLRAGFRLEIAATAGLSACYFLRHAPLVLGIGTAAQMVGLMLMSRMKEPAALVGRERWGALVVVVGCCIYMTGGLSYGTPNAVVDQLLRWGDALAALGLVHMALAGARGRWRRRASLVAMAGVGALAIGASDLFSGWTYFGATVAFSTATLVSAAGSSMLGLACLLRLPLGPNRPQHLVERAGPNGGSNVIDLASRRHGVGGSRPRSARRQAA
jgi:hypothetical protein